MTQNESFDLFRSSPKQDFGATHTTEGNQQCQNNSEKMDRPAVVIVSDSKEQANVSTNISRSARLHVPNPIRLSDLPKVTPKSNGYNTVECARNGLKTMAEHQRILNILQPEAAGNQRKTSMAACSSAPLAASAAMVTSNQAQHVITTTKHTKQPLASWNNTIRHASNHLPAQQTHCWSPKPSKLPAAELKLSKQALDAMNPTNQKPTVENAMNNSLEELWTDDDFDDSFVQRATQMESSQVPTPKPVKRKRETPLPFQNKTARTTFSLVTTPKPEGQSKALRELNMSSQNNVPLKEPSLSSCNSTLSAHSLEKPPSRPASRPAATTAARFQPRCQQQNSFQSNRNINSKQPCNSTSNIEPANASQSKFEDVKTGKSKTTTTTLQENKISNEPIVNIDGVTDSQELIITTKACVDAKPPNLTGTSLQPASKNDASNPSKSSEDNKDEHVVNVDTSGVTNSQEIVITVTGAPPIPVVNEPVHILQSLAEPDDYLDSQLHPNSSQSEHESQSQSDSASTQGKCEMFLKF